MRSLQNPGRILNMVEYYLWLIQVMGAANPRSVQLLRRYGSAEAVHKAITETSAKFLKPGEADALKSASLEKSREIMQKCEEYNYRIITLDDEDYPAALKHIYNPPILLFAAGELPAEGLNLAVVGTREACDYSFRMTKKLCSLLAREGITIISGMAIGIDKTAHSAAVEAGGKTIGVLACGFAVDYPKFSTPFRQEILDAGGAIVCELLPGQRGERGYFNYRNRIMSGLSRGVLIVEAGEKSGCHITAAHAINQNRDLFCVPPSDIFSERFSGVIGYLRDGAIPVFDHTDILNEYFITPTVFETGTDKIAETKPFNTVAEKPPAPDLTEVSGEALKIAELLKDGAKTVDFLADNASMPADELSDLLLELELDGVIESVAGSSYKLSGGRA
jgi:DNA processing protein